MRCRHALTIAVLAAIFLTALTGCGVLGGSGAFVELIEDIDGVSSVDSHGGGLSDSSWLVTVTPEAGLSDEDIAELADDVAADLERWDGALPEQLLIDLGASALSIPRAGGSVDDLIDNWVRVRDDDRVLEGVYGESTQLRTTPLHAFALARELAQLNGGIEVTDDDDPSIGLSPDSVVTITVEPGCDDTDASLAAFESAFSTGLGDGSIAHAWIAPCSASSIALDEQSQLLSAARAAQAVFAEAGVVESLSLSAVTEEEASGFQRTWTVSLDAFTPEADELLALIYALPGVTEVQLTEDNWLMVIVAKESQASTVEDAIDDAGLDFDVAKVRAS